MRRNCFIGLFLLLALTSAAQTFCTRTFSSNIRTLRVQTLDTWQRCQEGERVAPVRPILTLDAASLLLDGSDAENTLEISFDELSHDVHMYTFTVYHLNADGTKSDLLSSEYLRGFTTQDITDYEHSLNTSQPYTHYRFTFPNEDMALTMSGNYVLSIYEDADSEKQVATVCFSVVEPLVSIAAKVRANTDIEFNGRYQQLDIDLDISALNVQSADDIRLLVRQNGRLDNEVRSLKPTYVEPKRLRYINQKSLIFEGGTEFHHFDTYSAYFAGVGVERIMHDRNDYHAFLTPFEQAQQSVYVHEFDVNGQYVVNAERTDADDVEAEYMWVHWIYPAEDPWFDGALYVGGELFENRFTTANRMTYDADNHCYWLTSLVKQGGVDYQYYFLRKGDRTATLLRTGGSYWQTQNEYQVFVYYRPIGARADRLIGFRMLE